MPSAFATLTNDIIKEVIKTCQVQKIGISKRKKFGHRHVVTKPKNRSLVNGGGIHVQNDKFVEMEASNQGK